MDSDKLFDILIATALGICVISSLLLVFSFAALMFKMIFLGIN